MKKILVLLFAATMVVTFSASAGQPTTAVCFKAPAFEGSFDYTYEMGGCTIRICGTITGWDDKGPHGVRTITITDGDGNSLSWDEPYGYHPPADRRTIDLDARFPELEELFYADVSSLR